MLGVAPNIGRSVLPLILKFKKNYQYHKIFLFTHGVSFFLELHLIHITPRVHTFVSSITHKRQLPNLTCVVLYIACEIFPLFWKIWLLQCTRKKYAKQKNRRCGFCMNYFTFTKVISHSPPQFCKFCSQENLIIFRDL